MKRLCLAAVLLSAIGAPAATIRIDPASSTTAVGGTVDVNVSVVDVTDLYAYQFDVSFDPAVVAAQMVTEAGFLPGGGSTFFFPGTIDNVLGMITLTAGSLEGPVPGVSGSGALATLRFMGLALGVSPVALSNVVLLDSASGDIAADIENGSVTVVPEPGSAMLFALGTAAGVVACAMRKPKR